MYVTKEVGRLAIITLAASANMISDRNKHLLLDIAIAACTQADIPESIYTEYMNNIKWINEAILLMENADDDEKQPYTDSSSVDDLEKPRREDSIPE